jgi:5-methylcytosine-specific restriction endonuclease McrA
MNARTLLVSYIYEPLTFLSERKALKLICKDKVDIISHWEDVVRWPSGKFYFPATLRLKNTFRKTHFRLAFSRETLAKRDQYTCQYCNLALTPSQITIDHILPRSQGGIKSFTNCVIACQRCNIRKANKTLRQSGMRLLQEPIIPKASILDLAPNKWHSDWKQFICQ